jgi:hypothetical protein
MTIDREGLVLRKYPLLFFFLIAYAISWFFWTPLLLAKQGIISCQSPQYLHLLGSLGPAVAALIMTRVCGDSVGLQNLWRRMFDWRVSLVWHAIAWLPLLLFFIFVLLTWLTNSTGGNIFIAAIFHGTMDIAFVSAGSSSVANILGVLVTIWGLAVLSIAKPQYLSHVGKVVMNVHLQELQDAVR